VISSESVVLRFMRTRGLQWCQVCSKFIEIKQSVIISLMPSGDIRAPPPLRARHLIFLLLHRAQAWMYDGSLAGGITTRLMVMKFGVS
jgi:hypothetical protein